jgi:hypothetical protein
MLPATMATRPRALATTRKSASTPERAPRAVCRMTDVVAVATPAVRETAEVKAARGQPLAECATRPTGSRRPPPKRSKVRRRARSVVAADDVQVAITDHTAEAPAPTPRSDSLPHERRRPDGECGRR